MVKQGQHALREKWLRSAQMDQSTARIPAIDRIFEQFVKLSAFFVASPLMVLEKR
jgi:hypothetical protein